MREIEEKEIEEIEELGKLTIDELEKKEKELKLYECEIYRKRRAIETAIRATRMINLYKEGGFRGLYEYIDRLMNHPGPEGERRYAEDDRPFH